MGLALIPGMRPLDGRVIGGQPVGAGRFLFHQTRLGRDGEADPRPVQPHGQIGVLIDPQRLVEGMAAGDVDLHGQHRGLHPRAVAIDIFHQRTARLPLRLDRGTDLAADMQQGAADQHAAGIFGLREEGLHVVIAARKPDIVGIEEADMGAARLGHAAIAGGRSAQMARLAQHARAHLLGQRIFG